MKQFSQFAGLAIVMSGMGLLTLAHTPSPVEAAEPARLEGSWSGSGTVSFASGGSEKARCRATFKKYGGNSYGMSASCATSSHKVSQSAELERVSANKFIGDFSNSEFGVSGSIRITVHGSSLSASLSSSSGSAHFSLSR